MQALKEHDSISMHRSSSTTMPEQSVWNLSKTEDYISFTAGKKLLYLLALYFLLKF